MIWFLAISLSVTLYSYGQVRHYWYANDEGLGYEVDYYRGDSLDHDARYEKGYKYRYDIWRFQRNAEARTILIILILTGASASSLWISKRGKPQKLQEKRASQSLQPTRPMGEEKPNEARG